MQTLRLANFLDPGTKAKIKLLVGNLLFQKSTKKAAHTKINEIR